jgi:hypothetical protein
MGSLCFSVVQRHARYVLNFEKCNNMAIYVQISRFSRHYASFEVGTSETTVNVLSASMSYAHIIVVRYIAFVRL